MNARAISRRIETILLREPSWIAECASSLGIAAWGVFVMLTDNYVVSFESLIMPVVGFVIAPWRLICLARLNLIWRAILAAIGFVWWWWIISSLYRQTGVVPAHSGYGVALFADLVTVAKFSVVELQAARLRRGHG